MMKQDVNVHLMDLPHSVRGLTTPNDDGSYSIFLNARLNHEQQLEAYNHEMRHILNDDFSKENVQSIEYEAHQLTQPVQPKNVRRERILAICEARAKYYKKRKAEVKKQLDAYLEYRGTFQY